MILTDPHNPSGVLLDDEERRWLAATAEERNVDILVDEVYIDFDDRKDGGTDSPWRTAFRLGLVRAKENGDNMARWIEKRPDLEWVRPDTGITAFPRLVGGGDAAPFLDFARERHGVLAVPGRFFEDPRGFRLGFGIDPAALAEALDHLGAALAERP